MTTTTPLIVIAKCVWGDTYTKTMLTLNIPSLLSKHNVGSVNQYRIEHCIYTTPSDRDTIKADPIYRSLTTNIQCRIFTPDVRSDIAASPYETTIALMNAYHQRIMDDCAAVNATWLFDQPDHVWADGSLLHLVELACAHWDVVFFPGVRTNISEVTTAIGPWRDEQTGVIQVPSRSLVDLAMKHMHFHDLTRFWGTRISTSWPHHIAWRVAQGCFLRRSFYPQPFLINARRSPRLVRSVDFSYINTALEYGERVHFITDSDDFFVAEVTDTFKFVDYSTNTMSMELIGNWAIRYASSAHCEAFSQSIVYHTGDVPQRRLGRISRFADSVSRNVNAMRYLDQVATSIMAEHPRAASFIKICLSQSELACKLVLPKSFTLDVPPEAQIPDHSGLCEPLSSSDLDLLAEWIQRHILPASVVGALSSEKDVATGS